MPDQAKVGVLGASGYTGSECVRLLLRHPRVAIAALTADRRAGQEMREVFPQFSPFALPKLVPLDGLGWATLGLDLVFCALLALFSTGALFRAVATTPDPAAAASPQKQTTRSPHGSLVIPCENCHTAKGWRPVRANLEFDHNKTNYPLRGMHEKVQCTQCHVKPVFADVGKNCADCHSVFRIDDSKF